MNIILWIVFGAIVGWLASIIMRTDAEMGPGANVIVGILGALLGGWIVTLFGGPSVSGFNLPSFLVAILGAVVLLAIVRGFRTPVGRGL
ncbi:MAG TPA: GlsB/YeaQ/YmgE family stress response membrane protein [Verrucomicrobiae bacterium]|nr:GlsB/YeaQ/YmgE family stress response membrane protein [Verrucomicrobiae bacterium]